MEPILKQDMIKKGSETSGLDIRNISMNTIRIALIAGIGAVAAYFLLPIIADMVWDAVSIGVGAAALLVMGIVVRGLWNNIGYISDIISKNTLGWIISYDPFVIQEKQISRAEDDLNKLIKEQATVQGKWEELHNKLMKAQDSFQVAVQAEKIARQAAIDAQDQQTKDDMLGKVDDMQREQTRNANYIKEISPIANDMEFIINFVRDGSKVMKRKIKQARQDLATLKDTFESANAGRAALSRIQSAMTGNTQLNNDADRSRLYVMQSIAASIGEIKTSMEIVTEVTRDQNLQDAARMSIARKQLQTMNIGEGGTIPMPTMTQSFNKVATVSSTRFTLPD